MARPKSISDQKILQEAYDLIMEYGPHRITFELLATKVGLVPAALVRRFKNKEQLLLRIDQYALENTTHNIDEAVTASLSPTETIIAQFIAELSFASTIQRFANGQEFLLMDLRDKKLYDNYQMSFARRHEQTVELLQEAQATGELKNLKNTDDLARHLEVIAHGAGHSWAMTQDGSIAEYITRHINAALDPYRAKQKRFRFR